MVPLDHFFHRNSNAIVGMAFQMELAIDDLMGDMRKI
jgi:hypothetical protein